MKLYSQMSRSSCVPKRKKYNGICNQITISKCTSYQKFNEIFNKGNLVIPTKTTIVDACRQVSIITIIHYVYHRKVCKSVHKFCFILNLIVVCLHHNGSHTELWWYPKNYSIFKLKLSSRDFTFFSNHPQEKVSDYE